MRLPAAGDNVHGEAAVGEVRVTATVAALRQLVKPIDPVIAVEHARAKRVADKLVPFLIDVRADLVRDAAGGAADLDPFVKRRRPEPERLALSINPRDRKNRT